MLHHLHAAKAFWQSALKIHETAIQEMLLVRGQDMSGANQGGFKIGFTSPGVSPY